MKKFFGLVVFGFVFLLFSSPSLGCRIFFSPEAVKSAPSIPSERAVVVYRGGVETLIIESALEGEGEELGWVIPLPSVPTEFETVSGGFIETLSQRLQPDITHSHRGFIPMLKFAGIVMAWFVLIVVAVKYSKPIRFLAVLFLIIFLYLLFMPKLSYHRTHPTAKRSRPHRFQTKVVDSQELGNYDIVVLEAENADGLDGWLEINGFAKLDNASRVIVTDYIGEGWCFVAAKLRRETDGYSVPHPISVKFASEKAVYPIRLNAMAGSDVYLELYVIAEGMAEAKGMELEFCDIYKFDEAAEFDYYNDSDKTYSGFSCGDRRASIGHSKAFDHMWDGCIVNRLDGTVEPDEMNEDIILDISEAQPYRTHYYSYKGAAQTGGVFGILLWCILVVALTAKENKRIRAAGGRRVAIVHVGLKSMVISVIVAGCIFLPLNKVRTITTLPTGIRSHLDIRNTQHMLEYLAWNGDFSGLTASEIRQIIEKDFGAGDNKNLHTGQIQIYEDSPGNFIVLEDERGVVIRSFWGGGFPVDFAIDDIK